ncbi:Cdc4 and related F-box and WD-40 proteins [Phaffia rhodozyma]|uniref:Cdc4 and related F-box and WD-40 proteins n=1 Tax=Phaffia rhodozyma TaxID=264483 RepID=A0A0F7SGH1_PHARH|nr:Cdc4 and related F-box and WD-40 proteins [Phaffia rhodozyma]
MLASYTSIQALDHTYVLLGKRSTNPQRKAHLQRITPNRAYTWFFRHRRFLPLLLTSSITLPFRFRAFDHAATHQPSEPSPVDPRIVNTLASMPGSITHTRPSPLALSSAVRPPTPAPSPGPRDRIMITPPGSIRYSYPGGGDQPTVQHLLAQFIHLPASARHSFLTALLPLLTTSELLSVSNLLSPRLKRDFLRDLPLELSLHVLSFIDSPRTLARASQVSKVWRRLLEDEWTWKEMCARHRFARMELASVSSMSSSLLMTEADAESVPDQTELGAESPGRSEPPSHHPATSSPPELPGPTPIQPLSTRSSLIDDHPQLTASPSTASSLLPAQPHVSFDSGQSANSSSSLSLSSSSYLAYSFLGYNPASSSSSSANTQLPTASQPPEDLIEDNIDGGSSDMFSTPRWQSPTLKSPPSFVSSLTSTLSSRSQSARKRVLATLSAKELTRRESSNSVPESLPASSGNEPMPLVDLPERSASSPLILRSADRTADQQIISSASEGKGKGKGKGKSRQADRRASMGLIEGLNEKERERTDRFSYKKYFKEAYLTESNWLRGGRILSTHTSTDEAVVTSLAVDETHIVIGMANSKIHIFDCETGAFLRSLQGHGQGVWALTLVSQGGVRRPRPGSEEPNPWTTDTGDHRDGQKNNSQLDLLRPDEQRLARSRSSDGISASSLAATHSSSHPGLEQSGQSGSARTNPYTHTTLLGSANPTGSSASLPPQWEHGSSSVHLSRSSTTAASSSTEIASGGRGDETGRGNPRAKERYEACGSSRGWGQEGAVLVTGGCDRSVRVWDLETGLCKHIMPGHTSTIRCIKVIDGRPIAISGSRDATLRVWDLETGKLIHLLLGHQHSVRCIEVHGNRVVSGSYDFTARLWDVDTGECLQVFQGHYHQIYAVGFDGDKVATGSLDSTVRVWSAHTGECLALLQGHTSLVGQLQLTNDLLVTGGSDGRVIVFSLSTFECLQRLCAHDNSVTCLQFDNRFIVTGGNDGRVKLWDLRSGQFIRELSKPCEAIYRVTFLVDKCIVLAKQDGKTVMEIMTFRPNPGEV